MHPPKFEHRNLFSLLVERFLKPRDPVEWAMPSVLQGPWGDVSGKKVGQFYSQPVLCSFLKVQERVAMVVGATF